MLVFGTRPEAIKMAPLVKEFQKHPDMFQTLVCVTGQHREMLDQVLKIFDITPDYDLNIMKQGQDLYDVTARVLLGMRDVLKEAHPDVVLVHGDTTTSTAAALAAFYQQIPVGHVEAGLRTHNIYSPWPEEMNRQITGRIATYNFAPTLLSKQNLLRENVNPDSILVTGNTVIDALRQVVSKIKRDTALDAELEQTLNACGYDVNRLKEGKKLVLITGHRRENFGEGFIHICTAIKDLTQKYPDVDFVYPMHLNPNVRKPIQEVFEGINTLSVGEGWGEAGNMFFIEPLEYLSFVYLMEKSNIVLTDSGGIQEEAPGLGKPVLVMRDTTERPEALDAGTVKLVGTDYNKIVHEVSTLLDDEAAYEKMSMAVNPYGDGLACGRIVRFINNINMDMRYFPVFRLNDAITEVMDKIISIDIKNGIENGLDPEIHFVDEQGPITTVAEIKEDLDKTYHVVISEAYAQFLWLMCDIAFRIHESIAIRTEFKQSNAEEQKMFISHLCDDNEESRYMKELFCLESVLKYCADSTDRIKTLFNKCVGDEELKELYGYDMTSTIGEKVNSLYVYAMVFILLHEFSHHSLKHDFNSSGSVSEENEADENAFWSIYSDLEGKKKRTAKRGILCALVSLLFLNKDLKDDGIHPKPIERIFKYYDLMQEEGEDYAPLLCYLFYIWAVYAKDKDMPTMENSTEYGELLEKMKKYLLEKESQNNNSTLRNFCS